MNKAHSTKATASSPTTPNMVGLVGIACVTMAMRAKAVAAGISRPHIKLVLSVPLGSKKDVQGRRASERLRVQRELHWPSGSVSELAFPCPALAQS